MFANNCARIAAYCLVLCLQFVIPIQLCLADPTNNSGGQSGTTTPAPVDLDLSSTSRTVTSSSTGTILVGDTSRTVQISDMLTPAEHVALLQTLNGGTQSINLAAAGNAVGGNFTVNSQTVAGTVSSLVVPQGVTGISTLTNMQLTGNLTNYGFLYAVSTNAQNTTATINANNIYNQPGALLTSVLPTAGLPGITNAIQGLNLSLIAVNNIINAGTISSAGNLTAIAGGSIINSLPTNVTALQPVMQAVNNINLTSNIGNIVNSGLINAVTGNINISSQIASNLVINNVAGQLQALNGSLNVRDILFTGKYDLALLGGDIITRNLNLYTGQGTATVNVKELDGILNITGGAAHVNASTSTLELGRMALSGDPTFYNQGDILLHEDITFPGQDLAIISSANIIGAGAQIINTSSNNLGGSITLMAGASFMTTGDPQALPPSPDSTSLITINGASSGGGKIDLASVPVNGISSVGAFNSGGNVTMVAYAGTRADSGTINLAPTATITTGSGGPDLNGDVVMVAGASSGTAIQTGSINTTGADNGSGKIFMLTSQASLTGCTGCTGLLKIVDGTIIEGHINTNNQQYPTTNASIVAGDLSATGAPIQLLAGGTVNVGTITTSGSDDNGVNGGIALLAGANSGTSIQAGNLTTSNGTGSGSGNIFVLTSLPDLGTPCTSCILTNRQANAGGNVLLSNATASGNIDFRVGGNLQANTLTSRGDGQTFGGTVGLQVNNVPGGTDTFVVGAAGNNAVQNITVQGGTNGGGTVAIVSGSTGGINIVGQSALTINKTAGQGSAIGINATAGTLTTSGRWNMDGSVQGDGGFLNLAAQNITFTTPVRMTANATIAGNGGIIQIHADNVDLSATSANIQANGIGDNGTGGLISLTSGNDMQLGTSTVIKTLGSGSGYGGQITLASAGALDMTAGPVSLTATAIDGQGGVIVLGGSSITMGTSNLTLNASSTSQLGGAIIINATSLNTGAGTLNATANSTMSFGGSINMSVENVTTGSGAIHLYANSNNDFGGSISLYTPNVNLGTGRFTAFARGAIGGGYISALVDSMSGQADMAINADATGTQSGDGGAISLSTLTSSAGLILGNQAGQINLSADGYSSTGANAKGGYISVTTGGDLTLAGPGLTVSTNAPNGDGGQIDLFAGTGGQGAMVLNGNVQANATGTGIGGVINLSYADSNPIISTGVISARGISGPGGTITISNSSSTAPAVAIVSNNTMTVRSTSGTAGNIFFQSQGDIEAPTQDVSVSGTGAIQGRVTAIGRNVAINMSTNTSLTVGTIQATNGDLSLTANTVTLDQDALLSSAGALTINARTITNNGAINAGGDALFEASNNLLVSGQGTLSAETLTLNSSGGLVRAQLSSLNTNSLSGSAATSFNTSLDNGDLAVQSVTAQGGDLLLTSQSGNLTLLNGAALTCSQGNITLQDNSASGVITFMDGATLTAFADNGKGQINVLAGAATRQLIAGTAPSGFTTHLTNGGRIYFGTTGITSAGTNNVANIDRSKVVFGTGSAPATAIVLHSNVTFNATYAPAIIAAATSFSSLSVQSGSPSSSTTTISASVGPVSTTISVTPVVNPVTNLVIPLSNGNGNANGLLNAINNGLGNSNGNGATNGNTNNQGLHLGNLKAAADEDSENNFRPVAFVQPAGNLAGARAAQQPVCGNTESAYVKHSYNANVFSTGKSQLLLKNGELFVAAQECTTVKTGTVAVKLERGAQAQIAHENGVVKIRNLYDGGKGISILLGDKFRVNIQSGQELVVIRPGRSRADSISDLVGRRRIKETTLPDGQTIVSSEYSLLSVIQNSHIMGGLFNSKNTQEKALADKMMKMSVCLMTVTSSHGAFTQE